MRYLLSAALAAATLAPATLHSGFDRGEQEIARGFREAMRERRQRTPRGAFQGSAGQLAAARRTGAAAARRSRQTFRGRAAARTRR